MNLAKTLELRGQVIDTLNKPQELEDDAYTLFICDYCKRNCTIISKASKKPVSCPFLDEFIPMPWKNPEDR